MAIDLPGCGTFLRELVDDANLNVDVFDARLKKMNKNGFHLVGTAQDVSMFGWIKK